MASLRDDILAALDAHPAGEMFGLEVAAAVRRVRPWWRCLALDGRVYPALRQLEYEGVLVAREVEGPPSRGGRPRYYYKRAARRR